MTFVYIPIQCLYNIRCKTERASVRKNRAPVITKHSPLSDLQGSRPGREWSLENRLVRPKLNALVAVVVSWCFTALTAQIGCIMP